MECCSCVPTLRPPCCHHHLLPREATTPHLRPITIPSFPNLPSPPHLPLATAAARRGTISRSAVFRHRTGTAAAAAAAAAASTRRCDPPTPQSAPEEEEPCEVFPSPTGTGTPSSSSDGYSRRVALAAATLGMAAAVLAADGKEEAVALGPEGPLAEEEFWDNVRRYGVYILTVSSGAIYTILQPIVELLKNPISAILLLIILGGSFYLLSQVLSLMVGINEFSYDYAN